jgi:hypothetical protein
LAGFYFSGVLVFAGFDFSGVLVFGGFSDFMEI